MAKKLTFIALINVIAIIEVASGILSVNDIPPLKKLFPDLGTTPEDEMFLRTIPSLDLSNQLKLCSLLYHVFKPAIFI